MMSLTGINPWLATGIPALVFLALVGLMAWAEKRHWRRDMLTFVGGFVSVVSIGGSLYLAYRVVYATHNAAAQWVLGVIIGMALLALVLITDYLKVGTSEAKNMALAMWVLLAIVLVTYCGHALVLTGIFDA